MATTKTDDQIANRRALKHAGSNLWQVIAIASIALHIFILGDNQIAHFFDGPPAKRQLAVQEIGFADGMFYQRVEPVNSDKPLQASWVATISSNGPRSRLICGGYKGLGTYKRRSQPIYLPPDAWVGGVCPLKVGVEYIATASWQWFDGDGESRSIATEFHFVYEEPKGSRLTE